MESVISLGGRGVVGGELPGLHEGERFVSMAHSRLDRSAVLEGVLGEGRVIVSTVSCLARYRTHPVARVFLHRLIDYIGRR